MSIRSHRFICLVLIVFASTSAWAEISAQGDSILLAGITNGSDPVGITIWQPLRTLPAEAFLNPSGEGRHDGRPDLARDPLTGQMFVVWAYNAGSDHDIAISSWDGESWGPIVFLTSSLDDEIDPRVYVDFNGDVHVGWWVADRDEVYVTRRKTDSAKWKPQRLVTDNGARPSLAVHEGELRVTYESRVGALNSVGVTRVSDMTVEVVYQTSRAGRLDPVIHSAPGRLWIDYKASDTQLGVLSLTDAAAAEEGAPGGAQEIQWTSRDPVSWSDPTWIGLETARHEAWRRLLQN